MLRSQCAGTLRSRFVRQRTGTAATRQRAGAAAVEFAVVLPLIVMLVLGAIEIGRAIMIQQSLVTAARGGARLYGLTNKATAADVTMIVDTVMAKSRITGYTVTLDPVATVGLDPLEPVSVSVSVPYSEVAWLPPNWLVNGVTLTGKCTMPIDPSR